MVRNLLGLSAFLFAILPSQQTPISTESLQTTLSRAEALYYEAQFNDAVQLLAPLDLALAEQPNRAKDSVKVKLQLALAYIGLNEPTAAKVQFEALCRLDPDYELESQQFAPKVVSLFNEVRANQTKLRCSVVCNEAENLLEAGDLEGLHKLLQSAPKGCPCLQEAARRAAETAFKQGLEEYKNDDLPNAFKDFENALTFNPKHELAAQYSELTQSKLQFAVDRVVLDWKKHFEAREFPEAVIAYQRLLSPALGEKATPALAQVRTEYRKRASAIVETSKQSCGTILAASLDARQEINAMLPDPSIAKDIADQITPCSPPAASPPAPSPPAPSLAPSVQDQPCLQVASQLAMTRLKTMVKPEFPRAVRITSPVSLVVKVRIDKTGNVTVSEVQSTTLGLNMPVKTAVEQWKFIPALVDDQARCVETELSLVLNP